jgi:hypothetical protein
MSREARMLYVLTGGGYDAVKGEVIDPYLRCWSSCLSPHRSQQALRQRPGPARG